MCLPLKMFQNGNRTHRTCVCGNRTHELVKSEKSKTFLWVKLVNETRPMVENWESNPWTCVWQLNSALLFFFFICLLIFYTLVLVMVILKFWGMAKGAYEAGHCLHGHHKFGWISLHRCMRSVSLDNISETGV